MKRAVMILHKPKEIVKVCIFIACSLALFCSCKMKEQNKPILFEALNEERTGLHFINKLKPSQEFNMFTYMYFYNGAGVGAGDFNNDGLVDLFFASNQGDNKLFINKGKLSFEDVTAETKIPQDHGWSTGVSVIDINNDGLLDIYICKVGKYEILNSKNQLLICKGIDKNGVPYYQDEAQKYGLDFSGFSTQAFFLDYDMDGDLDMFLLNHSIHQNGNFAPRKEFLGTYHPLSGDRIYRNDDSVFIDVTRQTAINSSAVSYGLGATVADINLDGWPDLYVGNDFHENDYLYINQKNGTFSEEINDRIMHTSKFSMGVDVADINNDGYPEIISTDMLPFDPYILKRSLGDDDYDIFNYKISIGYNYQYSRNNLQFNRRNGLFSETGLYSGVYATDWSWAPLWVDFDNDGRKDLFISNGIPKRLNDMDYINFISNEEIQQKLRNNKMDEQNLSLMKKFPEIKIPNKFFANTGDLRFYDVGDSVSGNKPTYSNGAVYADLDNDGDIDIVVNNIDDPVELYENKSAGKSKNKFAEIKLRGPDKNINALGAKIFVFAGDTILTYEKYPAKGFQSSMEIPIVIGLGNIHVDSTILVWPDNTYEHINVQDSSYFRFIYKKALPKFDYSIIASFYKNATRPMEDISRKVNLNYRHSENLFPEFNREPLIPHMLSTEGPALAVADINKDGLDDVFAGSSKTFHNSIFLQKPGGTFEKTAQPEMMADSMYEDVNAVWIDANNDGFSDLAVASGGNEYYGKDEHLLPRLYINDGTAHFKKSLTAFKDIYETTSCIVPCDFNGDGFIDLFIGGRAVPWDYGEIPKSYLLQNDGKGDFSDVTEKYAGELSKIGMVTNAVWFDIDRDGDKDLLICTEWGGIFAFIKNKNVFIKKSLTDKKGWWNFILPVDIDNDGDIDIVAGNLGLNSRLKASDEQPVKMYYNDFDDNGKKEQLLTYFVNNKVILFNNKEELQKQLPGLKKKFLYSGDFAKSSLEEIFSEEKLENSQVFSANFFSNAILINDSNLNFVAKPLPWMAQLTSYRDAVAVNANDDSLPDILLMGNYYDNNIQMGRYDGDFGSVLINKGRGEFDVQNINGLQIKGQVRHISEISINKQKAYVLARNNDSLKVIRFVTNK